MAVKSDQLPGGGIGRRVAARNGELSIRQHRHTQQEEEQERFSPAGNLATPRRGCVVDSRGHQLHVRPAVAELVEEVEAEIVLNGGENAVGKRNFLIDRVVGGQDAGRSQELGRMLLRQVAAIAQQPQIEARVTHPRRGRIHPSSSSESI